MGQGVAVMPCRTLPTGSNSQGEFANPLNRATDASSFPREPRLEELPGALPPGSLARMEDQAVNKSHVAA